VEEVGSTLRPLPVATSGPFSTRGITRGDFFREVVAILLQSVAGVEVGFLGAVHDSLGRRSSFFAVAGRVRSIIVLPIAVPRVEGFSEFLQNALTGLRM